MIKCSTHTGLEHGDLGRRGQAGVDAVHLVEPLSPLRQPHPCSLGGGGVLLLAAAEVVERQLVGEGLAADVHGGLLLLSDFLVLRAAHNPVGP